MVTFLYQQESLFTTNNNKVVPYLYNMDIHILSRISCFDNDRPQNEKLYPYAIMYETATYANLVHLQGHTTQVLTAAVFVSGGGWNAISTVFQFQNVHQYPRSVLENNSQC